ncbi:MAG: hypothetical protein V4649_13310 [Bacteroidota bacterium]
MLKGLYAFCLALLMFSFIPRSHAQRGKSEIAVGYGYYSIYSIINHSMNDAPYGSSSAGTLSFDYRYYLSRTVTLGLGVGIENITTWGNFVTFAPEITVAYLDTKNDNIRVRLYGAAAYGFSIMSDNAVGMGEGEESGVKPWAFQATPIGMRIGRQFAGFLEVGLGYKGLIRGGMELRFPRVRHHHHDHTEDHEPTTDTATDTDPK